MRKRVRGVDGERRERGVHVVLEIFFEPFLFGGGALARGFEEYPVFAERGNEVVGPAGVFVGGHCGGDYAYAAQLLARAQPVEAYVEHARFELLLQARNAYFEKLVEVAADNRQETHLFEHGESRLGAEVEHAAVERQPTELAVEISWGCF